MRFESYIFYYEALSNYFPKIYYGENYILIKEINSTTICSMRTKLDFLITLFSSSYLIIPLILDKGN